MTDIDMAHSGKNGLPPQPYSEHVHNVTNRSLQRFDDTFRHYPNPTERAFLRQILALAAEWHDFGKLMPECQKILQMTEESKESMPNHVDAGVAVCVQEYKKSKNVGWLYAGWMVLAHHVGFTDWDELVEVKIDNKGMFPKREICLNETRWRDQRIAEYVDKNLESWSARHRKQINLTSPTLVQYNEPINWFSLLMTFSCMVASDHEDTSMVWSKFRLPPPIKLSPKERRKKVIEYAELLSQGKSDLRTKDRQLLFSAANRLPTTPWVKNDGPVGTGKSNANNNLSLLLADKYGLDRIYNIAPFCNILKQNTAKAKRSMLLDGEYQVGVINELHNKVSFKDWWLRKYNARWDGPITFTSAVQFFETLTAYHPVAVSKLHNFANSAIVLDEYHQAMPYELWSHSLYILNELTNNFNCKIVLSSGTPVDFWDIFHRNISISNMLNDGEIKQLLKHENRRVKFYKMNSVSIKKLVSTVIEKHNKSTLVVLNTTHNARVVYRAIQQQYNGIVCHISNKKTPYDNQITLKAVMRLLERKAPVILVATSSVECGVDFSFERGFREETGLPAMLQFNGRINRNNEYGRGYIHVFRFNKSLVEDGTVSINPTTKREIQIFKQYDKTQWTPEYGTDAIQNTLSQNQWNTIFQITEMYKKGKLQSLAKECRLIKTNNQTVVVRQEIIDRIIKEQTRLPDEIPDYELAKDISKHSVSVYPNVFNKLLAANLIIPLDSNSSGGITMWGLLNPTENYDKHVGIEKVLEKLA